MRAPALIGAVAVLVCGGCGGSPLSSSGLRTTATKICLRAESSTARIPAPRSPLGSAAFLKRGATVLEPELRELRALRAPGALSAGYGTALTAFSAKLQSIRETEYELAHGADPVIAMKRLQAQLDPIEARENDAWSALAIPDCANR